MTEVGVFGAGLNGTLMAHALIRQMRSGSRSGTVESGMAQDPKKQHIKKVADTARGPTQRLS